MRTIEMKAHRPISGVLVAILLSTLFPATLLEAQRGQGRPRPLDPSRPTGPAFGDLPEGLPDANAGALEGGQTGEAADAAAENVLQAEDQRDDGVFNVPSNGPPSPLFGAEAFTQQLMRFEEFGTERLDRGRAARPKGWQPLPSGGVRKV